MANPSAEQVQMANEVLAGTREITGTSAGKEESPMPPSDDVKRQAMEVTTPEIKAQVTHVEATGYVGSSVQPVEPNVGVERAGNERMPDWSNTQALDTMRNEKAKEARDISGPGE